MLYLFKNMSWNVIESCNKNNISEIMSVDTWIDHLVFFINNNMCCIINALNDYSIYYLTIIVFTNNY